MEIFDLKRYVSCSSCLCCFHVKFCSVSTLTFLFSRSLISRKDLLSFSEKEIHILFCVWGSQLTGTISIGFCKMMSKFYEMLCPNDSNHYTLREEMRKYIRFGVMLWNQCVQMIGELHYMIRLSLSEKCYRFHLYTFANYYVHSIRSTVEFYSNERLQ